MGNDGTQWDGPVKSWEINGFSSIRGFSAALTGLQDCRRNKTEVGVLLSTPILGLFFFCSHFETRECGPDAVRPLDREAGKRWQMACKPGSVPSPVSLRTAGRGMAIPLGRRSPVASRDQPGRQAETPVGPWLPMSRPAPIRSCSRWGLPCRDRCRPRGALLPHPFTLTRPEPGGLLSVALSLGSPPPGVTRHRVSVEPGLSSPPGRNPAERPSGHLPALV